MTATAANLLSVRKIPTNNERDLLLPQLLDGDLQRIRLALEVDQHRRVHADLQRARAQDARPLVLGHEGRGRPVLVRNPLVLVGLLALSLIRCRRGVARHHDVVLVRGIFSAGLVLLVTVLCGLGLVVVVDLIVFERGLVTGGWRLAVTRQTREEGRDHIHRLVVVPTVVRHNDGL